MIYAVSTKHKIPENAFSIDVTSRSTTWGKHLSPFNLGPVKLYDDYWAYNVENAYQYCGLFAEYATVDIVPAQHYWPWAQAGWQNIKPKKYPMGPWSKPLGYWWDGKLLTKLEAQNKIFLPLYKQAVVNTSVFKRLKEIYETSNQDMFVIDFEGYNHRLLEQSWDQVVNNPDRPIGQAFVLCMLLEGYL
jgi:hypothetical protein